MTGRIVYTCRGGGGVMGITTHLDFYIKKSKNHYKSFYQNDMKLAIGTKYLIRAYDCVMKFRVKILVKT